MPREDNLTKMNRLSDWGNAMMCGLPALSRRRRKRIADKKRRQILGRELRKTLNKNSSRNGNSHNA